MDQFQQRLFKIGEGRGGAFDGGAITVREPALLPFAAYSKMENVKKWHPGISKRGGMQALHRDSISFGKAINLYQFSKGQHPEIYTYVQYDTGDVHQLNVNPPTTNFTFSWSTVKFSGDNTGLVPASWSDNNDIMAYSSGADQHQLFPGNLHNIGSFNVFQDIGVAMQRIPEKSADFTDQVLEDDDLFAYIVYMDAQQWDYGQGSGILFVMTPVPANRLDWKINNPPISGSNLSSDLRIRYCDIKGNFEEVSGLTDTTWDGNSVLGQDGYMSWDHPDDEKPHYLFGQTGYWYAIYLEQPDAPDVSLEGVDINQIQYSGDWRPMENVWDGVLIDVIEAFQSQINEIAPTYTYPASAVDFSGLAPGVNQPSIFLSTADPAYGFYFDFGETPSPTAVSGMKIKYYDGVDWQTVTPLYDQTTNFRSSGFVTWEKNWLAQKFQYRANQYQAYWYAISFTSTVPDNVIASIRYMPMYSMNREFGKNGICNAVWKDRGCYTSSIFDRDIYVSANGRLNVLNGSDYAILEPGDGRRNRTVCVKKFHNEIIAWQEEKGRDGGCTTLFEGYNPSTFGKLVLSSQVGTFSAKSAVVIDGATTTTRNDDKFQTMAYWISHYGIFMTDGRIVTMVSGDIQNYFDSDFSADCIRLGYENEMWVEHDIDRSVLRFGLVCGPTATVPNVFPVFDLEDGTWSFDTYANTTLPLTCALQCEAKAGTRYPIIHIGANKNGLVYLLNYEYFVDDDEAISMKLRMEFNNFGLCLDLREANMRYRGETQWGFTQKNVYENGILRTDDTEFLTNDVDVPGQSIKRHRVLERIYEETFITLELINDEIYDGVYLIDLNLDIGTELNK